MSAFYSSVNAGDTNPLEHLANPQGRPSLLIAEDSAVNRALLRALFKNDFNILEARNGEETIKILKTGSQNISMLFLDMTMPIVDGWGVLNFMFENDLNTILPVICITAISDTDSKIQCYKAGAIDVIEKPYDEKLLYHKVMAIVEREKALHSGANMDSDAARLCTISMKAIERTKFAVYSFDATTRRITYCNPSFKKLPTISALDMDPVGHLVEEIILSTHLRALSDAISEYLQTRSDVMRSFIVNEPLRSQRFLLNLGAVQDASGSITDYIVALLPLPD